MANKDAEAQNARRQNGWKNGTPISKQPTKDTCKKYLELAKDLRGKRRDEEIAKWTKLLEEAHARKREAERVSTAKLNAAVVLCKKALEKAKGRPGQSQARQQAIDAATADLAAAVAKTKAGQSRKREAKLKADVVLCEQALEEAPSVNTRARQTAVTTLQIAVAKTSTGRGRQYRTDKQAEVERCEEALADAQAMPGDTTEQRLARKNAICDAQGELEDAEANTNAAYRRALEAERRAEVERCDAALKAAEARPGKSRVRQAAIDAAATALMIAVMKTYMGQERQRSEKRQLAELLADAEGGDVSPGEVIADGRRVCDEMKACAKRRKSEGAEVYMGAAKLSGAKREGKKVTEREDFPVQGPGGVPTPYSEWDLDVFPTKAKASATYAEYHGQFEHASEEGTGHVLYSKLACGGLYHRVGESCGYVLSRKPRPDDVRKPSPFSTASRPMSAERLAELAAAETLEKMSTERLAGDVEVSLEGDASRGVKTYRVYTRGRFTVREWKKSKATRIRPSILRRFWPTAEAARADAEKVIREKTKDGYRRV